MRLWTLDPCYLDSQGLGGLWRELCVAFNALSGKKKGYSNHPQLIRFKYTDRPLDYIGTYAWYVYVESARRGYNYNRELMPIVDKSKPFKPIKVTLGQVEFERQHLINKLTARSPEYLSSVDTLTYLDTEDLMINPIFEIVPGPVEDWEKI